MTTYYDHRGVAVPVSVDPATVLYGTSAGGETLIAPTGPSGVSSEGGGGDILVGGEGDNWFYAKVPTDIVQVADGLSGVKTVVAYSRYVLPENVHNLYFSGGEQWGIGNDLNNLIVMSGNDKNFMDGMAGDDVLVGGWGQNNFNVAVGNGNDVIYNFHVVHDTVRVPGSEFVDFEDVKAAMSQVGSDVVLRLSADETLTFRDVQIAEFQPKNFLLPLDVSKLGGLTFHDEFDRLQTYDFSTGTGQWLTNFAGDPLDIWTYQISGNHEKQIYTDVNFRGTGDHALGYNPFSIDSGVLTITAEQFTLEDSQHAWGQSYSSGMLNTKGLFAQQYGYWEIRAEVPFEDGTWPAFWLAQDPYKGGVEADILEHLGMFDNVHFIRAYDGADYLGLPYYMQDPTGMHTYGMLWTQDELVFYVDGLAIAQTDSPTTWDKPMYMLMNLAVGGWGGPIDDPAFPAEFKIDYVRVYGLADNSHIVDRGAPPTPDATIQAVGGPILLADSSGWTDVDMLTNGKLVLTAAVDAGWGSHSAKAALYDSVTGGQLASSNLYTFAGAGQAMNPQITTLDGGFWRVDYTGENAPQGWEVYDGSGGGVFFKNQYTDGDSTFTPLTTGARVATNTANPTFAVIDAGGGYHVHDLPAVDGERTHPSEIHALSNGGFFFTYAGQSEIDVFNGDGSTRIRTELGGPVSEFTMASTKMPNGQFAVAWIAPPADDSFDYHLMFQTFDSDGQPLTAATVVALNQDPWHTELQVLATGQTGEAMLLYSQGGLVRAAFAHGSIIDAEVGLRAGTLGETTVTALSDGDILLTWLETNNGVQNLWGKVIDPYTMASQIWQLGQSDGDVEVVALAGGGFAASWDLNGSEVARAFDGVSNLGGLTAVAGDFIGVDALGQIVSIYHDASGQALLQHYAVTDYFA